MKAVNYWVIGCGKVFAKYWLPLVINKEINLAGVTSLRSPAEFNHHYLRLGINYHQTKDVETTLQILIKQRSKYGVIALLLPADVKLELIKQILIEPKLRDKLVFVEKPYTRNILELNEYNQIIKMSHSRLHLSSKYRTGRAQILHQCLLKQKMFPTQINGYLIEGSKYFNLLNINKKHNLYFKDGPELDLGFHLLDIVMAYMRQKSDTDFSVKIKSNSVNDLYGVREGFLPKLGFKAELIFKLTDGQVVPMSLAAGKVIGQMERHLDFDFGDNNISQTYTTTNADDPVYMISENGKELLDQHPPHYGYYAREFQRDILGKQTWQEQRDLLEVNRVCIQLKELRLKQS
jgi:predicted dehydrogenase